MDNSAEFGWMCKVKNTRYSVSGIVYDHRRSRTSAVDMNESYWYYISD